MNPKSEMLVMVFDASEKEKLIKLLDNSQVNYEQVEVTEEPKDNQVNTEFKVKFIY